MIQKHFSLIEHLSSSSRLVAPPPIIIIQFSCIQQQTTAPMVLYSTSTYRYNDSCVNEHPNYYVVSFFFPKSQRPRIIYDSGPFSGLYFLDWTVPAPSTTTMQRIYGLNSLLTVRFYDTWKNNDDATPGKFILFVVRLFHISLSFRRRTICKETKTCVIFVDIDLATVIYRIVFNKIQ